MLGMLLKTILQVVLAITLSVTPIFGEGIKNGLDAHERNLLEIPFEKLLRLAEQGHAPSQFKLGFNYKYGKKCKEAKQWMQAAIDQNYPNAMEEMGVWYWRGECVSQNFKEAVRLFKHGANMKHPPAQYALGRMYYEGEGVSQNYILAHSWFILGSINGYDTAVHWREKTRKLMTPSQIAKAQELARNWKRKK